LRILTEAFAESLQMSLVCHGSFLHEFGEPAVEQLIEDFIAAVAARREA
jgi:hypothetical protein